MCEFAILSLLVNYCIVCQSFSRVNYHIFGLFLLQIEVASGFHNAPFVSHINTAFTVSQKEKR